MSSKKVHQIRVSSEVFEEISKLARPLVDSVDDVLRRVFGLPPKERASAKNTDAEQGADEHGRKHTD